MNTKSTENNQELEKDINVNPDELLNKIAETQQLLELTKKACEKKKLNDIQIQKWRDAGLDEESVQTLIEHHPTISKSIKKINNFFNEHEDLLEFLS